MRMRTIYRMGKKMAAEYNVHRVNFVKYNPKSITCIAVEDTSGPHCRIAVARQNGSIEIWCPSRDWTLERTIPVRFKDGVEIVIWCRSKLYSTGLNGEIIEWNLKTLEENLKSDSFGGPVWSMRGNNAKTRLVIGCEDGGVRLFDISSDSLEFVKVIDFQKHRVTALAWSFDDSILAAGTGKGQIRIYNTTQNICIDRITPEKSSKKDVMIWSLILLKDSTLISTDSEGRTQFWDVNSCTLLHSFQSHIADVLTICASENEKDVFTSGVDSKIVKFSAIEKEGGITEWTESCSARPGDHDVKSIVCYGDDPELVVYGGVDPRLTHCPKSKTFSGENFKKQPCIPHFKMCQVAAMSSRLMCTNDTELIVWQLPVNKQVDDNENATKSNPKQILSFKPKKSRFITSSTISPDGRFIAYCDGIGVNVLQMITDENGIETDVCKLKNLPCVNDTLGLLAFTSKTNKLVFATSKHNLLVYDLSDINNITVKNLTEDHFEGSDEPWTLLTVCSNDRLICAVNAIGQGYVFMINTGRLIFTLPCGDARPIEIRFQPKSDVLAVAYSDKNLCLFNTLEKTLTSWSKYMCEIGKIQWTIGSKNTIFRIAFSPFDPKDIFIHTKRVLIKVSITKKSSAYTAAQNTVEEDVVAKKKKKIDKYRVAINASTFLNGSLFIDFCNDGSIVAVEGSLKDLLASLAPPLKISRYGAK